MSAPAPFMVILTGIQGSGKTTFCRQFLQDLVHVNLDTLHTRHKEALLIEECIAQGRSFVVDNTNPTRLDRARYISSAKAGGYRIIGYYMESRLQECIVRNNLRTGKARLPAKAIAATSNRLELPDFSEGFDELYYVANDGENMRICQWRKDK